jgi:hypothetical protein
LIRLLKGRFAPIVGSGVDWVRSANRNPAKACPARAPATGGIVADIVSGTWTITSGFDAVASAQTLENLYKSFKKLLKS